MVRVPVSPQVSQEAPSPQIQAPQFQAPPMPGMQESQQLAQQIGRAGQAAMQIQEMESGVAELQARIAARNRAAAQDLEDKVNDGYATSAFNGFTQQGNSVVDGYLLTENEEAIESYESIIAGLSDQQKEWSGRLRNDTQTAIFGQKSQEWLADAARRIQNHARKQAKAFGDKQRTANIENLKSEYARSYDTINEPDGYGRKVFGAALVAISQDMEEGGIPSMVVDEETGGRAYSPDYIKRVRDWVSDAAEPVTESLLTEGRSDEALDYLKSLSQLGDALASTGAIGGVIDPGIEVMLRRSLATQAGGSAGPDVKSDVAKIAEIGDQAIRVSGNPEAFAGKLADGLAQIIKKNEKIQPNATLDSPVVQQEFRKFTSDVVDTSVADMLLGDNVDAANKLIDTYEPQMSAADVVKLRERVQARQTKLTDMQQEVQEKARKTQSEAAANARGVAAGEVARMADKIGKDGQFWSELSNGFKSIDADMAAQGKDPSAVMMAKQEWATPIVKNVVDTLLDQGKFREADRFLSDVRALSVSVAGGPKISAIDSATETTLSSDITKAFSAANEDTRRLTDAAAAAHKQNNASAFSARLFRTGQYGGLISGGSIVQKVESANIDGLISTEPRNDSVLVVVNTDTKEGLSGVQRALRAATDKRVQLLKSDEEAAIFEIRDKPGEYTQSNGIQIPTLANGDFDMGAARRVIEQQAPDQEWRDMAIKELDRLFNADVADKNRERAAVLEVAQDQIRSAVYENGRIPTLDDITDVALRAKVQALGLEREALAMPTEIDPVVLDNIEGDPARYLNESYLRANRHKMPDAKFREYMERYRNPDLPMGMPISEDRFRVMLIDNGMESALQDDTGNKTKRARIRSAIIEEARDYMLRNNKRMGTLEAEAALQDILSRKVYKEGSFYGYNPIGIEALQPDLDPSQSYYRFGDAYISIANYETVVQTAARNNLLPPGLSEQERANTIVDLYNQMKAAGRFAK